MNLYIGILQHAKNFSNMKKWKEEKRNLFDLNLKKIDSVLKSFSGVRTHNLPMGS